MRCSARDTTRLLPVLAGLLLAWALPARGQEMPANLALMDGVVAIADSQHRDRWGVDGWHPEYVRDGKWDALNIHGVWASDNWEVTHTIALVFPRQVRVETVVAHWGGEGSPLTPRKVVVQGLRDGRWADLATATPADGEAATTVKLAPVVVDALRLVHPPEGASPGADRRFWVAEVEVLGQPVEPAAVVDAAALRQQLVADLRQLRLREDEARVAPVLATAMKWPKASGFTSIIDAQDVARGRANVAARPWAKSAADRILRDADWWVAQDDEWIYGLISPDNPRAICPSFEKGCPLHGGARNSFTATLEAPDRWKCNKGGEEWHDGAVVTNPKTGAEVTVRDDGNGWLAPEGFPNAGRRYYFVAAYRYFVLGKLFSGPYEADGGSQYSGGTPVVQLALAHALTGDARYAHKAAIMLNRLAEAYRFYDGGIEGPSQRQDGYIGNTFERFLAQNLVLACDLIWDEVAKDGELHRLFAARGNTDYNGDGQADGSDFTHNLQRNLLGYIYEYLHRCMPYFDGDFLMYEMTALAAVGHCLGNPDIITETLESDVGLRVMLTNSWFRDGKFIYDSSGYNVGNAETPLLIAEWLHGSGGRTLLSDNETRRTGVSDNETRRTGVSGLPLDVYNDPEYRISMLYDFLRHIYCDGRLPSIGDGGGSRSQVIEYGPLYRNQDEKALARLPKEHDYYLAQLRAAAGGKLEGFRDGRADWWLIFHAEDPVADVPPEQAQAPMPASHVFDDGGVAILRAGAKPETRQHVCLTFSKGSYAHGHGDKLALNLFRRGYDLSADLGYPTTWTDLKGGGWETHTASHCTVMLDGKPQTMGSIGRLHLYATEPLGDVVEASAEGAYPGSSMYRRTVALVRDEAGEPLYTVDIFRVAGGKTRDYLYHSLGTPEEMSITLADPGATWAKQERGSLAGEDVAPMTREGYGFLFGVERARTEGALEAVWRPKSAASQPDRYLLTKQTFADCAVDFTMTRLGQASGDRERAVFVFATDPDNVNARRVIMMPSDTLPVGQAVPVHVEVTGGTATMTVDGQPWGKVDVAGSPAESGSLGFLHYYNYAWEYRDLVITPRGGEAIRYDFDKPLSPDDWAKAEATYSTADGALLVRDSEKVELHLHLLGAPGREIIRAQAEGYGIRGQSPLEGHLIVRDRGDDPATPTAFVGVFEAVTDRVQVTRVEALPGAGEAVALRVETVDEAGRPRVDIIFSALDGATTHSVEADGGKLTFQGRYGLIRARDGQVQEMMLVGGGLLAGFGKRLELLGDFRGTIAATEPDAPAVIVRPAAGRPPPDEKLVGRKLLVAGEGFASPAVYTVTGVEAVADGNWRLRVNMPLLVARGVVGGVDQAAGTFASRTPVMKLQVVGGLFDGKWARSGAQGQYHRLKNATREAFRPADPGALGDFREGGEFLVYDVGPGDEALVRTQGSARF